MAVRTVAFAAVLGFGIYAVLALPNTPFDQAAYYEPNTAAAWLTNIFSLSRVAEFVIGMTLVSTIRGPRLRVGKVASGSILAASYLLAAVNPSGIGSAALTLVPLCIFIVVLAQSDAAGEPSIVHHPILLRLGSASYYFYLVHQLVIRLENVTLARFGGLIHGLGMLTALAISLGAAELLHKYVEIPAYRRFSGRAYASTLTKSGGAGVSANR
ncbi:acyltransferase family protein [Arthrobacter sp. NA-172]|uniref:acyltransferase family protein n=1 Tax=Arthrobacter sp. NA-172 TaxID=3367524 RepID=UPI003754DAA6